MKIEKQVLSREQMAHLEELGVDTSDASMTWVNFGDDFWGLFVNDKVIRKLRVKYIPTYTIGDLVVKLPKEINDYHLEIRFDDVFNHISYYIPDWELTDYLHKEDMHNTPILDALYKTLCWVAGFHKELIK